MSIGMGWGNYADGISLKNPFLSLSDSFRVRKEFAADQGGTIILTIFLVKIHLYSLLAVIKLMRIQNSSTN